MILCPVCSSDRIEHFPDTETTFCRICKNWLYKDKDVDQARSIWFHKVSEVDAVHMRLRLHKYLAQHILEDIAEGRMERITQGLAIIANTPASTPKE